MLFLKLVIMTICVLSTCVLGVHLSIERRLPAIIIFSQKTMAATATQVTYCRVFSDLHSYLFKV